MSYTDDMNSQAENAAAIIINPFSVITFRDELFAKHDIDGAKEDWATKNAQLIDEFGAKFWLEELLKALSVGVEPDYVRDSLINPYRGIIFSKRLRGSHQPIIAREIWLAANEKLIKEIGVTDWIWKLLDVLETGGPTI